MEYELSLLRSCDLARRDHEHSDLGVNHHRDLSGSVLDPAVLGDGYPRLPTNVSQPRNVVDNMKMGEFFVPGAHVKPASPQCFWECDL